MRDFYLPGRSPVSGLGMAVASSHPLATAAALQALIEGGNAIDAAVTATAVLCVVEPQSTGIGGDGFALISRNGAVPPIAYNGSGRAPRGLPRTGIGSPAIGHTEKTDVHSVTVPGLVETLSRLLADHGTFSLAQAFESAIGYARDGFPVHQRVAADWADETAKLQSGDTARLYMASGRAPLPGEVVRLPQLARTLEAIAKDGPDAFYRGGIAEAMAGFLRSRGGYHQVEDFATHRGDYVEPVNTRYGGVEIWETPPNSQGVTTLLMLSILEALGFRDEDPAEARYHHLLAGATRLAFEARDCLIGDPAHSPIDVAPFLDKAHAARLAATLDRREEPPRRQARAAGDTAYVSVVDRERNAVSLISSLFNHFGTGLVDPETGIVFHSRGSGFCLKPGHPNEIAPGKRPLHTILPAMASRGGRVVLCFGVTGAHFQPVGQCRILNAMEDRGLDIQAAIDEPRSFFRDGALALEPHLAPLAEVLAGSGYEVVPADSAIGGAHGVAIDWESGVLTGGSDPRKDGCAMAL